jgi:hypothetical protein
MGSAGRKAHDLANAPTDRSGQVEHVQEAVVSVVLENRGQLPSVR